MKAAEAGALAQEVNTGRRNSQYQRVLQAIEQNANKGEYSCWFYENIKDDVRELLEKDGYKVGQTQADRDGTAVNVSW